MQIVGSTATRIAAAVRAGEVTPEEVLDDTLAAVEAANPGINAFVHVGEPEARAAARNLLARLRAGEDVGALAGVPTAMKDLFNFYPGWPSTFGGIPSMREYVTEMRSNYPERIEAAGAVMVGATNSPLLGYRGATDNDLFGATGNAFDLDRNSGGSSGGSAAAVASGLLPIAEGTDGGGSIRIPAAWSGVFGFQPSPGRVPMVMRPNGFGAVSPFLYSGPLARTVEDAALVLEAISGENPADPFSLPGSVDWSAAMRGSLKGVRVGYTRDFGVYAVDPRIAEGVEDAVRALEQQGAIVVPLDITLPYDQRELSDLWSRLVGAGSLSAVAGMESSGLEMRAHLPAQVAHWIDVVGAQTFADQQRDQIMRTAILDTIQAAYATVDIIACPTVGALAVRNAERGQTVGPSSIDGTEVDPYIGWCLTYLTNLSGLPAASLPGGLIDGLPFGVQLIGRRHDDALLLSASARFEEARPWAWTYDRLDARLTRALAA